jgi:hypothetical protein
MQPAVGHGKGGIFDARYYVGLILTTQFEVVVHLANLAAFALSVEE